MRASGARRKTQESQSGKDRRASGPRDAQGTSGRYVFEKRLAVGGMAELFLGRIEGPAGFAKRVVIKRILRQHRENEEFNKMFLDEARLGARFNHPNLVHIYELAKIDGQYHVAMEYVEGADLASILEKCVESKTPMPLRFCAHIVAQAAAGLHYAHDLRDAYDEPLNVVHRDVSPDNVIISTDGTVKVVDFGIAKHDTRHYETVGPTLKGKLSYMSPEQISIQDIDRRSDIFSLGVVLYELSTASRCFDGNSVLELYRSISETRYRPPQKVNPRIPGELADIINRMLQRKKEDRFQSAEDVERALNSFVDDEGHVRPSDVSAFLTGLTGGEPLPGNRVPSVFRDDSIVSEVRDLGFDEVSDIREILPMEETVEDTRAREYRTRRGIPWTLILGLAVVGLTALTIALLIERNTKKEEELPTKLLQFDAPERPSRRPRQDPLPILPPIDEADPEPSNDIPIQEEDISDTSSASPPLDIPEPELINEEVAESDDGRIEKGSDRDRRPKRARPKHGWLDLETRPPTDVFLRGKKLGTTPLRSQKLPNGTHELTLRRSGGGELKMFVTVQGGKITRRKVQLKKGTLRVSIIPWAHVFMGDKKLGTTPMLPVELYEGQYVLRLSNPELNVDKKVKVNIKGNHTTRLIERLDN